MADKRAKRAKRATRKKLERSLDELDSFLESDNLQKVLPLSRDRNDLMTARRIIADIEGELYRKES